MAKVLILGEDSRAFLSVIRSLGRAGVEVHVAWHREDQPAAKSRYIHQQHDLPSYGTPEESWLEPLCQLMDREAFDLVMPLTDQIIAAMQRRRGILEAHGLIDLIDDKSFEILFDKTATARLAREVGVPTPSEQIITADHLVTSCGSPESWPVIVKPATSYSLDSPGDRQQVCRADNLDQLHKLLSEKLLSGPVAVQEFVPGRGVGVELLLKDGEPLLAFQHRRVHEPLRGGGSSYRRSEPVSEELLDASLRLLSPLRYTGVAMVEFRVDDRTGRYALLEVNARFWGSLPLAIAAGADFPRALFEMRLEGRTNFPQKYRVGLHSRNLTADIGWQWRNLRANRKDPTLPTRHPVSVLWNAVFNIATFRERIDTFAWNDPAPALAEVAILFGRMVRQLRRRRMSRSATLPTGRRLLQNRLAESLAEARRVLFVCKGNICRSPFAEDLARKMRLPWQLDSAGYYPHSGRPCPQIAVAAARDFGVELGSHRSRPLTAEKLEEADIVFVFDAENHDTVLQFHKEARHKLHYLGAAFADGPLFIEDPWGGDMETFIERYRLIESRLHMLTELSTHRPHGKPRKAA